MTIWKREAPVEFKNRVSAKGQVRIDDTKVASTNNIQARDSVDDSTAGDNNFSHDSAATVFKITPNAHGTGIANAAISTFVNKIGGLIYTTILIDLHGGLGDGGAANDIIGTDGGAANAYIAELTAGVNGIPMEIEFFCLEVPTGGDPDINLVCSATSTDANDAAVTSGTVLLNNGDLTLGFYNQEAAGATLAALTKKYLYLTCGDTTDAAYTAGKIVIKITGAAFDYANA
tara:strand:- start:1122 stop:1814 length:693 start_codon:yes stop_codon:yes gene_type:complete